MKVNKQLTYRSFLDAFPSSTTKLKANVQDVVTHFSTRKPTTSLFAPVTFLLDYSNKKYLYVEESCFELLGLSATYFLETGLEKYLSRWHPEDFSVISEHIFPKNISFLQTLPTEEYDAYIFSYNYRFKNQNDHYITVLQRCSYIPGGDSGFPAGMVGVIFDITHFKSDVSIVHTIEKAIVHEGERVNDLAFKKVYPLIDQARSKMSFSTRELQILRLMESGLGSKQIAHRMGLSVHTVHNHRKNMLAKTACKSSAELIGYAVRHGFL